MSVNGSNHIGGDSGSVGQTQERRTVIGEDGWQGFVEPALVTAAVSGGSAAPTPRVQIRLSDSANTFLVPAEMLQRREDGAYYLPLRRADLPAYMDAANLAPSSAAVAVDTGAASTLTEQVVVPVIEEQVTVGKRVVESGRVRIQTSVQERQEVIDVPLLREQVTVERVPINHMVDTPPSVRQEGDTLIVPVVEEILVWEKRLIVKEELHVRRQTATVQESQTVTLRRQEAHIERVPAEGGNTVEAAAVNSSVLDTAA